MGLKGSCTKLTSCMTGNDHGSCLIEMDAVPALHIAGNVMQRCVGQPERHLATCNFRRSVGYDFAACKDVQVYLFTSHMC